MSCAGLAYLGVFHKMNDDHDNEICNKTNNRPFSQILESSTSRRKVLAGGLGLAATSFFAPSSVFADDWDDDDREKSR
ncbi:MAG: hypothetical protein MI921_02045, partial [Cytophagales bacterium]|nr:hypothetical protein [Cytophagales bacterium]